MSKRQNKQGLIVEDGQGPFTDIQKAVDITPRATAPVAHAPGPITEEDPDAAETVTDDNGDSGDSDSSSSLPDSKPTPVDGDSSTDSRKPGNCTCTHDGKCTCGASSTKGDDDTADDGTDGSVNVDGNDSTQVDEDVVIDMDEDVAALMANESNLTEGFKDKAKTIFEAAVKSKVRSARKEIHESYKVKLKDSAENILSTVTEQVDSYLTYVVESWMKENQVAVDSALRTEIAESFITSLKNVFAENYIEVPKADKDLVESLNSRVAQLQEEVKSSQTLIEETRKQNEKLHRKAILAEASKGLATTQASKLNELTKDTVFESVDAFTKKVATIKESYFSGKAPQSVQPVVKPAVTQKIVNSGPSKMIIEGQDDTSGSLNKEMQGYVQAISRAERNNPNRK